MDNQYPNYSTGQTLKKWYKSPGGVIFLIILGLILTGAALFMGMVGYYLWQVKFGDVQKLDQQFIDEGKTQMSLFKGNNTQEGNKLTIISDFQKYLKNYNPVFGAVDAKVTVVMFIDFECPFCREEAPIIKNVMNKYQGVVKFVFRNFPLENIHPNAYRAALAGACANEQDKFWQYHDLLFVLKNLDEAGLIADAASLGLDKDKFADCLTSEKYQSQIDQDLIVDSNLGLKGTPTFLVNGELLEGVVSEVDWDKIILKYLQK